MCKSVITRKKRNIQILSNRMNRNVWLKIFHFFDVADGMILCGRNVAFPVWKRMIPIETGRMGKKKRIWDFNLKSLYF